MLLRTFSKVYGLCGLRVGFALCGSEDFRTAVDQVRQPFFCNAAAQAAALEALSHQDEVMRRVERNLAERIGLEDGLRRLGLQPAESQANFVWFDLPAARTTTRPRSSATCSRASRERGILVRAGGALGRAGALRVTVGTEAENERFLRRARRARRHPALNRRLRRPMLVALSLRSMRPVIGQLASFSAACSLRRRREPFRLAISLGARS